VADWHDLTPPDTHFMSYQRSLMPWLGPLLHEQLMPLY